MGLPVRWGRETSRLRQSLRLATDRTKGVCAGLHPIDAFDLLGRALWISLRWGGGGDEGIERRVAVFAFAPTIMLTYILMSRMFLIMLIMILVMIILLFQSIIVVSLLLALSMLHLVTLIGVELGVMQFLIRIRIGTHLMDLPFYFALLMHPI
jgi:hypothetical protein